MTKLPKYFQMATVEDNAIDFYGGRLTNAERKGTLTEQLLHDQQLTQVRIPHAQVQRIAKIPAHQHYSGPQEALQEAPSPGAEIRSKQEAQSDGGTEAEEEREAHLTLSWEEAFLFLKSHYVLHKPPGISQV